MRRTGEWHPWGPFRAPARLSSPARAVAKALAAEQDRWALWLPVCLGSGIAVYFALPMEPDIWIGPLGIAAAAVMGLAGRRRTVWLILAVAVGTAILGFTVAQFRTNWVVSAAMRDGGSCSIA